MEIASLRFGLEWIYKTKVEIVNIGFENPNMKMNSWMVACRLWNSKFASNMKSFFMDGGL
jgi:hypothetical protein